MRQENGALGNDGFGGLTEDELQDCAFMNEWGKEELEGQIARSDAIIREAENQRASALRRLTLVS